MSKLIDIVFLMLVGTMWSQGFNSIEQKKEINFVTLGTRNVEESKSPMDLSETIVSGDQHSQNTAKKTVYPAQPNKAPQQSLSKNIRSPFSLPLDNLKINSSFGMRVHPISGKWKSHHGIDLSAEYENVLSVLDGIVMDSGWSFSRGNYMAVRSNDHILYYLHLEEYYFMGGQSVKAGNIIGLSGNTGSSTGPHLHFGVKKNNKWIEPMQFLYDLQKIKINSNL